MKAQINVRTIAESAGVSAMTVSRALRGEPNVDPATAGRIRGIAERLGYRRNLLVSTVMSSVRGNKDPVCSHIIAFLTVDSAGFPPVQRLASQLYIEGAQRRAAECGFAVEEFVMRPTEADSKKISRILYARNIRGLLVGPLCRSCGHLSLNWKEFASIAISINLVKPDLNRCSVEAAGGARAGTGSASPDPIPPRPAARGRASRPGGRLRRPGRRHPAHAGTRRMPRRPGAQQRRSRPVPWRSPAAAFALTRAGHRVHRGPQPGGIRMNVDLRGGDRRVSEQVSDHINARRRHRRHCCRRRAAADAG